ncbi:ABC transporter substrate-binding protein [Halosimplex salinum]|uniref:ABC transporter substrate-binding protein n=1 Tax=Halosimplex salinum TaxID=1710538 RepID=UPI0019D12231|nr:ABC transporter substrate-binding protein [Halosimplex salinum]
MALHRGTYNMANASWNPYDPQSAMANFDPPGLIYDPTVVWYHSHNEGQGVIANDWEKEDETTLLVELSEEWEWHNGDPVTTADWKTDLDLMFRISNITSPDSNAHAVISDYEAVDDYAMRFHLHDAFSTDHVIQHAVASDLMIKEDVGDPSFGDWRDDLMDVDAESEEASQTVSDFQEWTPSVDEVVGNGPFELVEVTDSAFVTEVYDGHPNAENINFTEYVIEKHSDQVLAFMEEEVDGLGLNLPASPDVMDQLPERQNINRDYNHAWSLLFNLGNYDWANSPAENPSNQPITSDRRVRHAISCAVDKEELWASVPQQYELYELPSSFLNQTTVDEGVVDIEGYDYYNVDGDRATALMEEAGYQRDGGKWYGEDGEPATLRLIAQSGTSVQVDALDSARHQLEEFGFDVTLDAVDEATYGEARLNGDHDIIFDNHPIFSLTGLTYVGFVWDWFANLTHADYNNSTWDIPAEIGNPDANETMEINVMDEIEKIPLTDGSEPLQRLTWWYNQVLPMYNCVVGRDYGAINASDWVVDAPDALLDNRVAEFNLVKISDATLAPKQE